MDTKYGDYILLQNKIYRQVIEIDQAISYEYFMDLGSKLKVNHLPSGYTRKNIVTKVLKKMEKLNVKMVEDTKYPISALNEVQSFINNFKNGFYPSKQQFEYMNKLYNQEQYNPKWEKDL